MHASSSEGLDEERIKMKMGIIGPFKPSIFSTPAVQVASEHFNFKSTSCLTRKVKAKLLDIETNTATAFCLRVFFVVTTGWGVPK